MLPNSDRDISVVVAAYGEVPYLDATLQSLVNTQPPEVPIYVLDDASPTNDVYVVSRKFESRVKYIRSDINRGVSGSFNAAADMVRTKFIMLVGPDDIVTNSLTKFISDLPEVAFDSVVIQPGVTVINSDGTACLPLNDRVKNFIAPKADQAHCGEDLAITLLKGDWAYNPSLIWDVDYLKSVRYNETLRTAMDLDILLRLTFMGQSIFRSSNKVFEYRRHPGAVSSVNAGHQQLSEEMAIHEESYKTAVSLGWERATKWSALAVTPRLHGIVVLSHKFPKLDWNLVKLILKVIGRSKQH